jgi:hypothetical protein
MLLKQFSPENINIKEAEKNKGELFSLFKKAKRLVPVSYTPWDSKESYEKEARAVDDLTLLYLYEYHTFEIRRL